MTHTLGGRTTLSATEARECSVFLRSVWHAQFARECGLLEEDLVSLRTFFDPVARGGRLRELLAAVGPTDISRPLVLDDVAVLSLDDAHHLVTPEGRGFLELLESSEADADGVLALSDEAARPIERAVAAAVRLWSRHRLNDVIAKQRGEGPPMHPASIALLLLLLINGSVSASTGVRRIRDKQTQERFDDVLRRIVKSYTDVAAPGNSAEDLRMWSGWHLSEARRRLPGRLVLDDEGYLFIPSAQVANVIQFVLSDLRRSRVPSDRQVRAFDSLVRTYRDELQSLTEMGSGFERVAVVDDLREQFT
jgi:hypothetical protein